MAKRHSFEELLKTEFRWPRQGDRPFVAADAPFDNANIANDGFTRLVLMMEGYKEAADLMVEAAAENRRMRDMLVFPIIFNYRQFLELSLKYQLATFGPAVGVEPNWRTHDLLELWGEFLEMLERYGTPDPDEADPIVGEIVLEFAKIDPGSYSYRYPVDRQGRPLPVAYRDLYLPTLADVMEAVAGYFTGSDGYLSQVGAARG
jgi:HEPN domain-containing protein